jgi:hypothetical protein
VFQACRFQGRKQLVGEAVCQENLANKFAPTLAARCFRLAVFKVGDNLLARRCQENLANKFAPTLAARCFRLAREE